MICFVDEKRERARKHDGDDSSDEDDDDFIEVEDKEGYEEDVRENPLGIPFFSQVNPPLPGSSSSKKLEETKDFDPGEGTSKQILSSPLKKTFSETKPPLSPESLAKLEPEDEPSSYVVFAEKPRFWGTGDDGDVVEVPGAVALMKEKIVEFSSEFNRASRNQR